MSISESFREDPLTCVGFIVCNDTALFGQATSLSQLAHTMSSN